MKWLFKFLVLTLINISAFGQTPEKMSYQAVIRDNSGTLLENSNVNLKIVLRQGSPNGATVYEETHRAMTNKNGLLSLEIGSGTIGKGNFNKINWSQGPFFIETQIDTQGKSNYNLNGISEILSVPYALHAKSADSFTGSISPSQLPDFYTADEIDNILLDIYSEETNNSHFSGKYTDLQDKPVLFSGLYSDLQNKPDLYDKTEIDNIIQGIETAGVSQQNLNLDGKTLSISGGNSISFENWDTNAEDDFSGNYDDLQNKPVLFSGLYADLQDKPELYDKTEIDNLIQSIENTGDSTFSGIYDDLLNKPELYNKTEIDNLIQGIETTAGSPQNLSMEGSTLFISGGNSISFENWDTNVADDFSGIYDDLQNKPDLYNKTEIDNLIQGIETTGGSPQNLSMEGSTLSISGGNSISFENWDTNAADDFSGIYDDLQNKPGLFSGQFEDLQNKPELYDKTEIDNMIQGIETTGGSPQNLTIEGSTLSISGGNSISFENWDTNAADDFSGIYDDLQNKPVLFSGQFEDLQNKPELYDKAEIDNIIQSIETTGGSPQNLTIEGSTLSISGGNSISFENWDTNAADDFSGIYDDLQNKPVLFSGQFEDLQNKPELYDKTEIDNIIQGIETTGGSPQNLTIEGSTLSISGGNSISFENWDTNAADDFSGIYDDLQNKPVLFSGQFEDLQNKPELYDKTEIDNIIQGIETTGGSPQNLTMEGSTLSISGGNSISFENWDTNAADDFSGIYDDLQNKPDLYNKTEIDNLIQGIETTGGSPQNLTIEGSTLSISGGNSISFENWDTNAADDFSGIYDDLQNKPVLFSGLYADLQDKPELYDKTEIDNLIQGIESAEASSQELILEGNTLSISNGNSISFDNWDIDASDDFDGEYSSLNGAPKVYTQEEVDEIKAEILKNVKENYSPKASVVTFSSSRSANNNDVSNTLACTSSATLTITSEFSGMKVGDIINLEVHGTTLTVKGASGVVINGKSGVDVSIGNNEVYRGGLIRKIANNSYIVL